jgi:hypothetical protein
MGHNHHSTMIIYVCIRWGITIIFMYASVLRLRLCVYVWPERESMFLSVSAAPESYKVSEKRIAVFFFIESLGKFGWLNFETGNFESPVTVRLGREREEELLNVYYAS